MEGVRLAAELMAVAAVTAPKSKGENFVQVRILKKEDLKPLGEAMLAYGEQTGKKDFDRDGKNVMSADAALLIGLKKATPLMLDCGACGFPTCAEMTRHPAPDAEFEGPVCALRLLDMGIALGSAVKTASMLNVDNRIMYRLGVVARSAGWIDWEYAMGIPLSVTGKNIFFDR